MDALWYAPLLSPVRPTIESALRDVGEVFAGDPWSVPRTGLGGALALHVARGFGSAGTRKARRACASSIEAWNQRVHMHASVAREAALDRALALSSRDAMRAWSHAVRRDDARAQRVIARLVPAWVAEGPVPEGVIFLRAAVAAGVLLGEVDDEVHARLDRWATFAALAWETRQGTLDRARWDGTVAAIGCVDAPYPRDPDRTARDRAQRELDALAITIGPESPALAALAALLTSIPVGEAAPREPAVWEPEIAPDPSPVDRPRTTPSTPLDRFASEHEPAIERAIAALGEDLPPRIARAFEYLRRQGGKRLRPLMVLASTRACGGEPAWATREAALVEWLHQGSLVIDDVIDGAQLRRGAPALHSATSVPFATAVTLQLLARLASAARDLPGDARVLFAEAAATLADGEWAEMQRTGDPLLSVTDYHRIVEAKTARLFSTASALGALAARATPDCVRAVTRAGHAAGLAFQIVDDLLDLVGDERELGKTPGTDLRAGKCTLPLILARPACSPAARARLDAIVRGHGVRGHGVRGHGVGAHGARDRGRPDDDLAFVRELVFETGAADRCRARARALLDRSERDLARVPDREGAALLSEIHRRCVERDR